MSDNQNITEMGVEYKEKNKSNTEKLMTPAQSHNALRPSPVRDSTLLQQGANTEKHDTSDSQILVAEKGPVTSQVLSTHKFTRKIIELTMRLGKNTDPSRVTHTNISSLIALIRIVDPTAVINPVIGLLPPITSRK